MARESIFPSANQVVKLAKLSDDTVASVKESYERAVAGWVNESQATTQQDVRDIGNAVNVLVLAGLMDEAKAMQERRIPAMKMLLDQKQEPEVRSGGMGSRR